MFLVWYNIKAWMIYFFFSFSLHYCKQTALMINYIYQTLMTERCHAFWNRLLLLMSMDICEILRTLQKDFHNYHHVKRQNWCHRYAMKSDQKDPLLGLIISWWIVFLYFFSWYISASLISVLSPSAIRITRFALCKWINLKSSVECFT